MTGQSAGKCGGCKHAAHRDLCKAKGPSSCLPLLDPRTGRQMGIGCTRGRQNCLCPWGWCHDCGQDIVGCSTLPLDNGAPEIDVDRGSAGDPAGLVAVWHLADGSLAARRLAPDEEPGPGEWRGVEHVCGEPATGQQLDLLDGAS